MDEAIFFRRPPETSHLLLFNLPKPPNHIEHYELLALCEQYGQLYDCTIRYNTAAATATTEDDHNPTQPPQQQLNSTQQPQPLPEHAPAEAASRPTASSSILPHELPTGATVASAYAHVHYFSLHDARTAKKALHDRLIRSCRIRATFSSRQPPAGRHTQLPFHACLSLMNGVVGYGRWSCAVKWLAMYDAAVHGQIVAGQTAGSAAVWELEAYERMRSAGWPCSFACEVELAVPGEVNVCCQAVSHSVGDGGLRDRENGRKRAVTNAYEEHTTAPSLYWLIGAVVHIWLTSACARALVVSSGQLRVSVPTSGCDSHEGGQCACAQLGRLSKELQRFSTDAMQTLPSKHRLTV